MIIPLYTQLNLAGDGRVATMIKPLRTFDGHEIDKVGKAVVVVV